MLDQLINGFDSILKTLTTKHGSIRDYPDAKIENGELSAREKQHALGLMRVNHSGEVCAQALYQGQALTARSQENREALQRAADEETEHLAWTESRVCELGGKISLLNPLFYMGSLAIGVVAGVCGDKWNLGFLAATEDQVEAHLASHLDKLPENDHKSRAVVRQMQTDEQNHAALARKCGAVELPQVIKIIMHHSSKIMTKAAYYV